MEKLTLEEVAAEFAKNHSIYPTAQDDTEYGFINGAKWQQERQDKFAIEFGDWVSKNTITYSNGKFRMKTLTPIFLTSEQLLERFKKEKGWI